MPKSHERILSHLLSTPWLIEENWIPMMVDILHQNGDLSALKAKDSDPFLNSRKSEVRDGIVHIPIHGPIFPKANLFTEICGATSLESVAKDFQAALDDDSIEEIILDIDSPGGAVSGVSEMAAMIYESRDIKPIKAYIGATGASAAYWIAVAASEIVISQTSRLGSIGVVAAFRPNKEDGVIELVNSASPNKRPDYSTEEGKKVVVEELDAIAEVFISTVASYRGVSEDVVKKQFGKGGIVVGKYALDVKMADRFGSFESLFQPKKVYGGKHMAKVEGLTVAVLKAEHPDVYSAVYEEGAAQAVAESEAIIKEKETKIMDLESKVKAAVESNEVLATRLDKLETLEAHRAQNELANTAKVIIDAKVGASAIPVAKHGEVSGKISKLVDHKAHIESGVFNATSYSEAVAKEVKDWEAMTATTIDGIGFGASEEETSSTEVDAIVDRLAKM